MLNASVANSLTDSFLDKQFWGFCDCGGSPQLLLLTPTPRHRAQNGLVYLNYNQVILTLSGFTVAHRTCPASGCAMVLLRIFQVELTWKLDSGMSQEYISTWEKLAEARSTASILFLLKPLLSFCWWSVT